MPEIPTWAKVILTIVAFFVFWASIGASYLWRRSRDRRPPHSDSD